MQLQLPPPSLMQFSHFKTQNYFHGHKHVKQTTNKQTKLEKASSENEDITCSISIVPGAEFSHHMEGVTQSRN